MSLSSFLLKASQNVDTELDALFKSQPSTTNLSSETQSKKRKVVQDQENKQNKRAKSDIPTKQHPETQKADKKSSSATPKKARPNANASEAEDTEDNSDLENNYVQQKVSKKSPATEHKKLARSDSEHENEEDEDEEGDPSKLVHESLLGKSNKNKSKHGPKQKYTPPTETPEERDRRTVFIGNVPIDVAQKRPLQKQLQRHILSFVPTARVESIRIRSVPFSTPTSKLPEGTDSPSSAPPTNSKHQKRLSHSQSRASAWREDNDNNNNPTHNEDFPASSASASASSTHLTSSQKKKIAFITHDFHSTASSVNAYLVFAHPFPLDVLRSHFPNAQDVSSSSHPLARCMDPYAAALDTARKADGSLFMERSLRVDLVGGGSSSSSKSPELTGGRQGKEGKEEVWIHDADPKRTVFVGNLDLESKEEDVRAFFEGLIQAERGGPPPVASAEEGTEGKKPRAWVARVRIIRDRDTQLGKGFCYVQFLERECVDEILALEPSQLKFAKRKLRVQRCKTIPGTKLKVPPSTSSSSPSKSTNTSTSKVHQSRTKSSAAATATTVPIPKGDPNLGNKLVNLSKEQRKQVKASDATRVARRLAKKKARMGMGTAGKDTVQEEGKKDRARVRKSGKAALVGGSVKSKEKTKAKKSRVRSEKSLEKRNLKK